MAVDSMSNDQYPVNPDLQAPNVFGAAFSGFRERCSDDRDQPSR